jgi:hypothetical protein
MRALTMALTRTVLICTMPSWFHSPAWDSIIQSIDESYSCRLAFRVTDQTNQGYKAPEYTQIPDMHTGIENKDLQRQPVKGGTGQVTASR